MSRRLAKPQFQGDEALLANAINPNYIDPEDEEAKEENENRFKMEQEQRMHSGIQNELYGESVGAMGYLNPPNVGRGVTGGWIFPLLAGLSALLGTGIRSSGMIYRKGNPGQKPVFFTHPPNMSSSSAFYRDIVNQATGQGVPIKTFHKLFGDVPTFRSMMKGKIGSGSIDDLRMGHLLAPLINSHLKKALKGTGIPSEVVMKAIEEKMSPLLEQMVTPEVMARGGSLLGTLWGGVKSVFGKLKPIIQSIFGNPTVKKIITDVGQKVGNVASSEAPKLAELAAQKIADYARTKLKGDEPIASEKPSSEGSFEPSATQKFEMPSAIHTGEERKQIIAARKNPDTPKERKILRWDWGVPIYGEGKKKTSGGAWTVKLVRH